MKDYRCPMCGAGKEDPPRYIGFRYDDMGKEFFVTIHPDGIARRCWHPFHKAS